MGKSVKRGVTLQLLSKQSYIGTKVQWARDEKVNLLLSLQICYFHLGNRQKMKPTNFHWNYQLSQLGKIVNLMFHKNMQM